MTRLTLASSVWPEAMRYAGTDEKPLTTISATSLSSKLLNKLKSKVYRAAYVAENVRMGIAFQIRAMREQRDNMSQEQLGKLLGKPQSVVSRLENPNYGKTTVQTLLEIAETLDVALIIQFVSFPEFLRRTSDVSPTALRVDSFDVKQFAAHQIAFQLSHILKNKSPNLSATTVVNGTNGYNELQLTDPQTLPGQGTPTPSRMQLYGKPNLFGPTPRAS